MDTATGRVHGKTTARHTSHDKLADGRSYHILTVVGQFTRECVALEADRSMHGTHGITALTRAIEERGATPNSITLDNGSEFTGRALEIWAIRHGVQLCFIRPAAPQRMGNRGLLNERIFARHSPTP